jgi:hypothetical protein
MKCPHCDSELDVTMEALIQLHNEDYWINHCEESFRVNRQVSPIERLPESIKNSERIIKYYKILNAKIAKRKQETNNESNKI